MKTLVLACMAALGAASVAHAGVISDARSQQAETWSAWGGEIGFRWNPDLMANLGLSLDNPSERTRTQDYHNHQWFQLRESAGLQFTVKQDSLQKFTGGSLQMRGGYVLRLRDGSSIDLRNLTLHARTDGSNVIDVVSADGKSWFYISRLMFELVDDNAVLAVQAADLRIAPALARRIGHPEASGWEIGDLSVNTQVNITGANPELDRVCSPYPWPGVSVPGASGEVYQVDLFMQSFTTQPVGCLNCTGPNGALTGIAAFAPSSTLKNNVNDGAIQATIPGDPLGTSTARYTADVAWYQKFTGDSAPYGNDQHPYLIWNLYRIYPDGAIEQIGRSGVKHAFLTVNSGCISQCGGSHQLGLGCADTYGVGNNDSPSNMGPRSEIIPATGQWGRCGSIFDPDCNGQQNSSGNTDWTQRMKVPESKIAHNAGGQSDGSTFLFDSWYIARDDINIYNSMATKSVNPQFSGSQWTLAAESNYRLGGAIDRWVDPSNPGANAMNTELDSAEGHAKVAVKVTDLGNGRWRYDYAVMNFDFARAETSGSEPNLRVISNKGFDAFSVPLPAGAAVYSNTMRNGEVNANTRWRARVADGRLTWIADAAVPGFGNGNAFSTQIPTLDWGTLYSFTVVTNAAPGNGNGNLRVAKAGTPSSYDVATLVPSSVARKR